MKYLQDIYQKFDKNQENRVEIKHMIDLYHAGSDPDVVNNKITINKAHELFVNNLNSYLYFKVKI